MRQRLDKTLQARGASDFLLSLLREEKLLTRQQLDAVAMASLRRPGRGCPVGTTARASSPSQPKRDSKSKLEQAKAPPPHVQVLAALALAYL